MKHVRIFLAAIAGVLTIAASPYRDLADRPITSLSSERIADLKRGAGAGYALPAELNGYPGLRHVLDLAKGLSLSADQRRETQRLFDAMKAEAIPLGGALIDKERALDTLFRNGKADERAIFDVTAEAAAIEARLRATHLKYHLQMAVLLTPHQRSLYRRLRGYHSGHGGH